MRAVARWLPNAVPRILGEDAGRLVRHGLSAAPGPSGLEGGTARGHVDLEFAAVVGRDLALIHARSAVEPGVRRPSPTTTRSKRSASSPICARQRAPIRLLPRFDALARTTLATKRALVHGDVSPKNILRGPRGPVFLDAECAWFGDPAFDLAFCLNHLLLKGARREPTGRALARLSALAGAYRAGVDWENADEVEARAAALLPAPVPRPGRRKVAGRIPDPRERARRRAPLRPPLIADPPRRLTEVADAWSARR